MSLFIQEEQRELAKTIRVSGSILLSTVSNFLDFFKMEAGKALDIVRTEVDLFELVSDVHCIIEAMIGRNGEVGMNGKCTCRLLEVFLMLEQQCICSFQAVFWICPLHLWKLINQSPAFMYTTG